MQTWIPDLMKEINKRRKKKENKLHKFKLFLAGMIQIMFVAANVYMVAHQKYPAALFTSFCLSAIWAFNVKHVSIGDTKDGLIYATGASIGTMIGMFLTNLLYS